MTSLHLELGKKNGDNNLVTGYKKSITVVGSKHLHELRDIYFPRTASFKKLVLGACSSSDVSDIMGDESDSWSLVEAEDEASRDRTSRSSSSELSIDAHGAASGIRQATTTPAQDSEELDLSASRGNDSPPRPAVLEAVAATSPEQSWRTASGLSGLAGTSASPFHSSSSQHTDPQADVSASQAFSHSDLQADGQNDTEQLPLPSLSGSDLPSSPIRAHTHVPPGPLPHLQTDLRDDDSFDNDDSMSEESSGTAVMVGHPCSDEEDTAERRWRLAEQRGNDIRRASVPPCPKAVGAAGYLKFIVVGESGLGKTTFIENLRSAFQPDSPGSARPPSPAAANTYDIFEQSPERLCTEVVIDNGSSKFHYFLQDTPGQVYGQTNVRIPDHITAQNDRYLAWEQSPHRSVPMSAGGDHRVDACLFFLNPNHLKDAEVADMVQLSELVPVVPMIAKADIFTPSELSAFRVYVRQRLAEEEERLGRAVMWRPAESEEHDEEDEGCCQPPFAVIASNHSDLAVGRFWPVRSYPWGKCEAFSSTNSDLSSLKRLLFEEGFAGLKQATETRYYRYRTSRLSHDAEREPGARLGQQQVTQHAEAGEPAEEEDPEWDAAADLVDSDASSEGSDMSVILAGDPAEAAAADVYGEHGQRQSGRSSWWKLGLLIAGVVCTLGCMVGTIHQLKADNRGLRKELAIKEQVVSNLAYTLKTVNRHQHSQFQAVPNMDADAYLPPIQPQTQQPLTGKEAHRHKARVKGRSSSDERGGQCTMLISPWRHTVAVPAKQKKHRRPNQPAAAKNATEANVLILQGHAGNSGTNASSNGTSNNRHLTPLKQPKKPVHQVITPTPHGPLAVYTPATIKSASNSALQSVSQAAQLAGRFSSAASANSLIAVTSAAQHSAESTVAAAKAVVKFSQELANKTCSLGHRTSLAVYHGLEQASIGVMSRLSAGRQAVKEASHATAASLGSFGSDVVDASRAFARDAPAVARRVQEDLGNAALDAHNFVRDTGVSTGKGICYATQQVSQAAQNSVRRLRTAYQDLKVPSTEWDQKAWIRFLARLGLIGAAL